MYTLNSLPDEERPLERRKRGWEDYIKTTLKEIVCDDVDWINVAQDKFQRRTLVNTVTNSSRSFLGFNAVQ